MGKFTTPELICMYRVLARSAGRLLARRALPLMCCLALAACGGGSGGGAASGGSASATSSSSVTTAGSSSPSGGAGTSVGTSTAPGTMVAGPVAPVPPAVSSSAHAARFLAQATYGPRAQDLAPLVSQGYEAWISAQIALPATSQLALLQASQDVNSRNGRMASWWKTVVQGPDQLRQRMALAWSEIFVVSDQSGLLVNNASALALYWDILARDGLGNFRTLLEDVTLSPAMGTYLNMLGNQKPDPAHNIHADENYARELMQLVTVGLVMLNPDGTPQTDAQGAQIPSYTQADVSNLARALTGWGFKSPIFFYATPDFLDPMIPFEAEHDTTTKTILGGTVIPAGLTARAELTLVLDTLFQHPNTPPFIARQLIQRLVTSNPSPAYVARVAQVFVDNGQHVRGDLSAVVRAILYDDEARSDVAAAAPDFGKLREPLLGMAHLWRSLDGHDANGAFLYWNPESDLRQAPLSAPSVFNFFRPSYAPPGPVKNARLAGPEFQLATASNLTLLQNAFAQRILGKAEPNTYTPASEILLHVDPWLSLATGADTGPLIDQLNLVLLSGQMSPTMRQTLVSEVNAVSAADGGYDRVVEAAFLILSSSQYQVQR